MIVYNTELGVFAITRANAETGKHRRRRGARKKRAATKRLAKSIMAHQTRGMLPELFNYL
jgi:hypothetical protein